MSFPDVHLIFFSDFGINLSISKNSTMIVFRFFYYYFSLPVFTTSGYNHILLHITYTLTKLDLYHFLAFPPQCIYSFCFFIFTYWSSTHPSRLIFSIIFWTLTKLFPNQLLLLCLFSPVIDHLCMQDFWE